MADADGGIAGNHTDPGVGRRLLCAAALAALAGAAAALLAANIESRPTLAAAAVNALVADASLARQTGARDPSPDRPPRTVAVSLMPTPTPAPLTPVPAPLAPTPAVAAPQPAASVHAAAPPPVRAPAVPPASAVPAIVQLVNQDRVSAGLPALQWSAALGRAAATHAAQNAANDLMSHNGLTQDVAAQGVHWSSLGECLGWNSGSAPAPSMVNQMWMNSPEHQAVIVGSYTMLGVGWAESSTGNWYVSLIAIS